MTPYTLTREERETTINFNEQDSWAEVTTCTAAYIRKLRSFGAEELGCENRFGTETVTFKIPKKWVKLSKPRAMTDEQKEAAGKRMREYRNRQDEDSEE